jgi:hypothetical protein
MLKIEADLPNQPPQHRVLPFAPAIAERQPAWCGPSPALIPDARFLTF